MKVHAIFQIFPSTYLNTSGARNNILHNISLNKVTYNTNNRVLTLIGVSKNVMAVGFQEAGRWMYTGGEDGTAKIW